MVASYQFHPPFSSMLTFHPREAAVRYHLGDQHTFEFVEGTLPTEAAPELLGVVSPSDELFAYAYPDDLSTWVAALNNLEAYLAAEGPFDGVLAFSQGASLAATYIVQKLRQNPVSEQLDPTFKCAIFFSAGPTYDPDLLRKYNIRRLMPSVDGEIIRIPTAHIWGHGEQDEAPGLAGICDAASKQVYIHEGGHEIPGTRMDVAVKSVVQIIRRVVSVASHKQSI